MIKLIMVNTYPKGEIFHVFNKSIANFKIFSSYKNCQRFINTLYYYNNLKIDKSLSRFIKKEKSFCCSNLLSLNDKSDVKFLAYVIMPDHYHLLLKIINQHNFIKFLSDVENSFSRYFNLKYNRKGPLWQSAFKAVLIRTNEQLLHISRYIHLNPTTNKLVEKPSDWKFSSYQKYLDKDTLKNYLTEISINNPTDYRKFVENHKDYQINLKKIKKLTLE